MKKIFVKYKWLLIALLMISIIAIPMVVNILFKFSSAFPAEWSAGDALSYVSGLQALLGTIILGIITVEQGQDAQEVNRRLSEENNRLQKIMSQKLLPAVKLTNPSCKPTMLHRGALSYVPQSKQFRIIRSYYGDSAQHETSEIRVNIDSLVEEIKYIKTIEFSLQNISESIIRHIQVDSVDIVGFQGKTELVACQNYRAFSSIHLHSPCLLEGFSIVDMVMAVILHSEFNIFRKCCPRNRSISQMHHNSHSSQIVIPKFLINSIIGIQFQTHIHRIAHCE